MTTRTGPLMVLFAVLAILGALLTILSLRRGDSSLLDSRALASGATMLVAGSLAFIYFQLWNRNARLLVGPHLIGYRDIVGRTRVWNASAIGAVIDVVIVYSKAAVARRALFVVAVDGRRLMAVNPVAWPADAFGRIARGAGKQIERRSEPMTAKAFRREFPHAMSWASTHPNLMGTLLAVLLIALPFVLTFLGILLER